MTSRCSVESPVDQFFSLTLWYLTRYLIVTSDLPRRFRSLRHLRSLSRVPPRLHRPASLSSTESGTSMKSPVNSANARSHLPDQD